MYKNAITNNNIWTHLYVINFSLKCVIFKYLIFWYDVLDNIRLLIIENISLDNKMNICKYIFKNKYFFLIKNDLFVKYIESFVKILIFLLHII